ncbi:hypothetical protein BGZ97_012290 [Linnemannia gamsii]|uniref:Uncharacterized protein n=1 Tax=Linnemannia gamsii TaxID=64522 RepID=A0A9P6R444_9FUNG|nr:hypothetical protein BGZ97_012290 [Linnemannia gamsii]
MQQQYPPSRTICCLSFHETDKIRLINAPESLVSPLRQAIVSTWNQSIKRETSLPQCGGHEFSLKGSPWGPSPKTGPLITSTNLVRALSRVMEQWGWSLILASNVSHVREEKDSLFFEREDHQEPLLSLQERDTGQMTLVDASERKEYEKGDEAALEGVNSFTVELFGYDTIRVAGAPAAVIDALRLAILRHWTQGHKEGVVKGAHEFTFTGCPFQTWGSETSIEIAMVVIQALENVRKYGFKLCESTDVSVVGNKYETQKVKEKQIIDSWVLRRSKQ